MAFPASWTRAAKRGCIGDKITCGQRAARNRSPHAEAVRKRWGEERR